MNVFQNIPKALPEEFFDTLYQQQNLKIERIVSKGHITPEEEWYDQDWNEWVILLSGAASLKVEGESELRNLLPGDCVMLPAHLRHRVEWTDPEKESVWLAIHFDT